jgi:hypothetical protein
VDVAKLIAELYSELARIENEILLLEQLLLEQSYLGQRNMAYSATETLRVPEPGDAHLN